MTGAPSEILVGWTLWWLSMQGLCDEGLQPICLQRQTFVTYLSQCSQVFEAMFRKSSPFCP